jgi:hypothetical protein
MKTRMTAAALALLVAGGAAVAEEDTATANRMLYFCTSPPDSTNWMFCGTYMAGFVDAASIAQATATMKHTCFPDYLSGTEARAIFIRFMKDKAGKHPEIGELSFSEVIWFAITEQFPCRKQ